MRDFQEAPYLTAATAGAPQAFVATRTLLGVLQNMLRGCVSLSLRSITVMRGSAASADPNALMPCTSRGVMTSS